MNPHRTNDPAKRAEHVADRLEQQHERKLADKGEFPYQDWPRFWLDTYYEVRKELVSP